MSRLVITHRGDTVTVQVGRDVEHITTTGKTKAQLFDAVKYAAISKGANLSDLTLAEIINPDLAPEPKKEPPMPTDFKKQGKAMSARNTAVAELIKRHQDEYDKLLGDLREDLGLARDAAAEARQAKINRLLEQLEKLGYQP